MTFAAPLGLARERADVFARRAAGRVEWKPVGALHDMRNAWTALAARALEPNVFYEPAFALAAAPVFGSPGAVLVWSKAGNLIGLFPARIERRYGVMATVTGWTHPYAPFGVPLVDRDEPDAAIAAFLDHVAANRTLVLLPLIAADGAFAAALSRALLRRGGAMEAFGAHARAMLAPGDRANYLDHVAHRKLKELGRQRRRLEDDGTLSFESACIPFAVATALADFMALEASGWKGRAGSAAIEHPAISAFMQDAVTALAADGKARIDRLTRNGKALAATITLRSGATSWFWKIGYDEAFARSSPGVQLTLDVTRAFLGDETISRVDSCAVPDHPMIDHIWHERLALADFLVAPGAAALTQFRFARHLETLRRLVVSTAKTVRDRTRS
jgi:CelD/BcsL family acetyltransferase involved in cellulose biosynthesis